MRCERVFRNATIYDGTGAAPFRGTVGLRAGRIAAVIRDGAAADLKADEEVDGAGLALSPGFIDFHSHSEWVLPQHDHAAILAPLVTQGITTFLGGNCGFSPTPVTPESEPLLMENSDLGRDDPIPFAWRTHRDYLDWMESRPLPLNVGMLAGHGSIRLAAMGNSFRAADAEQTEQIVGWCREGLEAGCFGVSLGLGYAPGMFAGGGELDAVARLVAEADALLPCHLKAYNLVSPFFGLHRRGIKGHNLLAIDEYLALAERNRVRAQISHLIFVGRSSWHTHPQALTAIERARDRGLDVAFDAYPYTAGNTTIRALYPKWAQEDLPAKLDRLDVRLRLRLEALAITALIRFDLGDIQLMWSSNPGLKRFQGQRFSAIGRALGMDPFGAYMLVTRLSNGVARIMIFQYSGDDEDETALNRVLAHPLCIMETDTLLTRLGHQNPASFGAFPRFLGGYCRDRGLLSLAEGIHRCTGMPAARMGLSDRGRITEGAWADLVLFDPASLAGPADFSEPAKPALGIHQVIINGERVVEGGRLLPGKLCGRVLRRS